MRRGLVIALLILLSVPASAGSHAATFEGETLPTATAESTQLSVPRFNLLILNSNRNTGFSSPSLDVAASIAIQRDDAETTLDRYTLEARLETAANNDEREAILRSAVSQAETQYFELRDRETSLRTAYREGTIDAETYVRELAKNDARAAALKRYIAAIDTRTNSTDDRLNVRLQKLDTRLIEFQGPVRDRALSSVRGRATPVRLYVSASPNGTVLSMIADTQHVREAYRDDKQNDASIRITLDEALDRMESIYPEATNVSRTSGINYLGAGIYRFEIRLPEITVTSLLHGGTEEVYHEVSVVQLTNEAANSGKTASVNGTRLMVNRSYRGGPLRIATYDNATGEPVDAIIIVKDTIFETGPDGVVWTLTPDSVQFAVTAVRPSGNVRILVRPVEPIQTDSER